MDEDRPCSSSNSNRSIKPELVLFILFCFFLDEKVPGSIRQKTDFVLPKKPILSVFFRGIIKIGHNSEQNINNFCFNCQFDLSYNFNFCEEGRVRCY